MRRRLVLLAIAGGLGLAAIPAAVASPPQNHGTQTACAALENSHGSQGGQQAGPPEDNAGTTAAEAALGCNDSD